MTPFHLEINLDLPRDWYDITLSFIALDLHLKQAAEIYLCFLAAKRNSSISLGFSCRDAQPRCWAVTSF